MDPIARTTRSESGERGRSEMVQTICGHSRCGAGARASRYPAEVMICARAATVGEAVAMQWRPWRRSAMAVTVWRCFPSLLRSLT
jgi:hypothetical protein